jgi:hypothetical protein
MRNTSAGNKMPESKKEAKKVLQDIAHEENIKIKYVADAGYTEYFVYKYYGGVSSAEEEIFGGKDQYTCDCCGNTFENRSRYNSHSNNCSEKRVEAVKKASKLLSDFYIEDDHYVYTLKIECPDEEYFWYVGESGRIETRALLD